MKITHLLSAGFLCIFANNFLYANTLDDIRLESKETQITTTTNPYDFDMLKAADLSMQGKFIEASQIYDELYKKTQDNYFLKQIALMQSQAGDINQALLFAKKYQEQSKNIDDSETNLIIAEDHMRKQEYNLAIILLEKVTQTNPNLQTHYILSNLYMQQKLPDEALKHYIHIYNDEMSTGSKIKLEALNQIITIYLQQEKIDLALQYLNNYIASNEYTLNIQNFIQLYVKTKRLDMLKDNLHKRFLEEQNKENLRMLIGVLVELKQHKEAIKILKEYASLFDIEGQEMLMQVYVDAQNFKDAMQIAKDLYKQTDRIEFLGLGAIYEFESIQNKNKTTLQPILSALKEMLEKRAQNLKEKNENPTKDDAFFYNFIGYVMIDYDIDINKGLEYVAQALAIEPNSIEYIDSLAWGFYKKGDCKQALDSFNLIPQDKLQSLPELIEHQNAISQCKEPKSKK